ncbi:MAG: hypothetical protein UT61_C0026G0004 [Candidatus Woesebacteria bacterium GW2011_GWA1_39_8]|uniref:Uncharacterized protein n=1 Tax=Candidatus Woesebacteria bacterium GW2011_GWA1_39_8 TaxID=1618552 RepID=A0A0G0SVM6_9BACT|nr:MAG: hypothetical protein UT61_C0026G0004 [Candidatus Woesebacteria bacterium GW2011_GWA1_39_8]
MKHEALENFPPGWGERLSNRYNSDFFKFAERIWNEPNLPEKVTSIPFIYDYRILDPLRTATYLQFRNRRQNDDAMRTNGLELRINLANFPKDIPPPRIILIDTPESRAMQTGRWKVFPNGQIFFCPPRLDLGIPAQHDIRELTTQLAQTQCFLRTIEDLGDIESEMVIVDLVRDPRIELQDSIYSLYGKTVPRTQVDVHHVNDDSLDNPFKRYPADINDLKMEGVNPTCCKVIIDCDPSASGMQMEKADEKLLEVIRRQNGGVNNISKVVFFSPISTLEAVSINALSLAEDGIALTVFSSISINHATKPLMYWCPPFYNQDHLITDPKVLRITEAIYGDLAYVLDPWCNWAAKRLSPAQALKDSEKFELSEHGLKNEDILNNALSITPERMINEFNLDPRDFVSFATIEEASLFGRLEELNRIINS